MFYNTMKTKKVLLLLTAGLLFGCGSVSQKEPAIQSDPQIEKEVEKILSKRTLEEKIGQMTQLTIDLLGVGD